jgi:hypothetical protein
MRYLVIVFLLITHSFAIENISLSKTLIKFQGDEYNILLAPKMTVTSGQKNKTRKAINKGYIRAISELKRQIKLKDIQCNLKIFTQRGSSLPQYKTQDIQAYKLLKQMLNQQVTIREQLEEEFSKSLKKDVKQLKEKVSVDDIDIDIDDDAFDISDEETQISENNSMLNISPAEAFTTGYIELSELYNQEVLQLYKTLHPFKINSRPMMKHVHSVFGMAFFPTKYGSVKLMRVYIVLATINTEKDKSVQIIAKEIPNFRWDRNYLYINAATGKVLRQIISGILGKTF